MCRTRQAEKLTAKLVASHPISWLPLQDGVVNRDKTFIEVYVFLKGY